MPSSVQKSLDTMNLMGGTTKGAFQKWQHGAHHQLSVNHFILVGESKTCSGNNGLEVEYTLNGTLVHFRTQCTDSFTSRGNLVDLLSDFTNGM